MVYPPVCCFCRRVHQPVPGFPGICRYCLSRLPLRHGMDRKLGNRVVGTYRLPLFCAADYSGPIRQALLRLKFGESPETAVAFAGILVQLMSQMCPMPLAIVPIPLHRWRLMERGYNQADLIAGCIARALEIPKLEKGLKRTRHTPAQSQTVSRDERWFNLAGAFLADRTFWQSFLNQSLLNPSLWRRIRGKPCVWLVDDVMTTGSTLTEAARPLLQIGLDVIGMVVASNYRPKKVTFQTNDASQDMLGR
jgi:ComF family protein